MARKRKRSYIIPNLRIEAIAAEGKCIAKHEDKVIFVSDVAPGDLVDVRIMKDKKSFAEGVPEKIIELSPDRAEPFCDHYALCGGCKWQHITYDDQLAFKTQQVKDALQRIGKINTDEISPILGSKKTQFYRNKLEFTFTNYRWFTNDEIADGEDLDKRGVGFHIPGHFNKVIDIQTCHLQSDISNTIRNELRDHAIKNDLSFYSIKFHEGLMRNVIIRSSTTGELMVIVQFGEQQDDNIALVMENLKTKFPEITALLYVVNLKKNDTIQDQEIICYHGNDHIFEAMEGLKFKISPKSFYQTNSEQAYELYKIARDFAAIQPDEIVYDLYTGTGTIANFVANKAKKVVGVEYVEAAIEDAKINSEINNISNTVFYAGDMKDVLTTSFYEENGYPDTIITDPPRAGMHADVIEVLLKSNAKKIVYVSCNPATQARDLDLLSEKYKVISVRPVDMFPHTHHVENVVLLHLK